MERNIDFNASSPAPVQILDKNYVTMWMLVYMTMWCRCFMIYALCQHYFDIFMKMTKWHNDQKESIHIYRAVYFHFSHFHIYVTFNSLQSVVKVTQCDRVLWANLRILKAKSPKIWDTIGVCTSLQCCLNAQAYWGLSPGPRASVASWDMSLNKKTTTNKQKKTPQ